MRLECDETGDLFVDPDFLSRRLCLTVEEFRRRLRMGLVTSLVEAGDGDDEGRRRLTVRCGRTAWRAIVDADNEVTSEELVSVAPNPPACGVL
jgi:hypothetical protein